jgi:hypothetical protein
MNMTTQLCETNIVHVVEICISIPYTDVYTILELDIQET